MIKIEKLMLNYEVNPIGITKATQFGWIIGSKYSDVLQTSYHLQVGKDEKLETVLFDSGLVKSEESVHVIAEGFTLESCTRYYFRVKITDNYGNESLWSEPGVFVTALLDNKEWEGKFISAETLEDVDNSKGTYVRGTFETKGNIKEAFVYTTALGLYNLYLNGQKVSKDEMTPGWTSYNKHLLYQTYDISEQLQEGNNAIGAMLGAGWYKGKMGFEGRRNNYGKQTAFLCQLVIIYEDGTHQIVVSDETWKGFDAPVVFSEIYDGETYDARKEIKDWNRFTFDDTTWRPVEIIAYDKAVLTAQAGCRVKEITEIPAKKILTTPEGDTVIDFGQNLTGWVTFKVQGKAGDVVELNCFEILDASGNVYLDNLRGAKETITYICKDEKEVEFHPFFTYQGFQYAKITSYPGEIKLDNFTAFAVHSDMEPTGTFECSNKDINQLQHNILWGLKGNFLDVPTDCPQRNERLGWTGDAQIFCRTASYLMNTYTFYKKWLVDVAADQTEEGGVPHVVPDILSLSDSDDWLIRQGTHSAAAWADVAVINPWTLYLTYGDKVILEDQYESMKSWVEFMFTHSKKGIWNYKLQFGDWVALDAEEGSYFGATPNDLTCTAFYAYTTNLFSKIANVLGKKEDYENYTNLYHSIKEVFQQTFFQKDGTLTAQTQTAHIISLYFDLVPEQYREKTVNSLIELLDKENGHLVTGFVGTPYFCHALSQNGHTKEAYDLLLKDDFPSWLYQVKMGATTVWEHWDGMKPDGTMWSPDMNSFNHYAYGAIGEWLYRVVAGFEINEEKPGYKHSIIHPHVGGDLEFVNATYDSVYGMLKVAWKVEDRKVTLEVTIPHNTTATIILDGKEYVEKKVGSGQYQYDYEI